MSPLVSPNDAQPTFHPGAPEMVRCCRASSGAGIRPGQQSRDWDEAKEWHVHVRVMVQRNLAKLGHTARTRVRAHRGWVPRVGTVGELKRQTTNWCFIADFFLLKYLLLLASNLTTTVAGKKLCCSNGSLLLLA